VASKKTGLEVNADKTSTRSCLEIRMQDSHSIKTDNSSFQRTEEFKCLGPILSNQNSTQEKIKSRLSTGYAIQKFKD
jgi:hypothetical protein